MGITKENDNEKRQNSTTEERLKNVLEMILSNKYGGEVKVAIKKGT